jgi:hypothetical protein
MTFSIKYKPLFQVNILHLFFLSKGVQDFISMNETEKTKELDWYDVSTVFNILPSHKTTQTLKDHNLVLKVTNTGFSVWSKVTGNQNNIPFIDLDNDLSFTFRIQIKDTKFYNYTNLKPEKSDKLYYFSNKRLNGESGTFPLINKGNDNNLIDEDFILSDEGAELQYSELSTAEKENLFALVQVSVKGQNGGLNLTNAQGKIVNPSKIFEILLDNRKTTWRYIFAEDQKVKNKDDVKKEDGDSRKLITKLEQPLTQKGFVSIELGGVELPNPQINLVKPNDSNTKYYSEIYM